MNKDTYCGNPLCKRKEYHICLVVYWFRFITLMMASSIFGGIIVYLVMNR